MNIASWRQNRDDGGCASSCALYEDGITAIEIANGQIRLVEWNRKAKKTEPTEFEKDKLSDFIDKATRG